MVAVTTNFSWMLLGRFVYAGCQWLTIIVIARLGKPDELGRLTYAMAIVSPAVMFSQLNLRAYMVTDVSHQFSFNDYLTTRILASIAALIVILAVACINDVSGYDTLVIVAVAAYKLIESTSDVYYGVLQKFERMRHVAYSLIAHGSIVPLVMMFSVILSGGVLYGALSIAVAWIAILLFFDMHVSRGLRSDKIALAWANIGDVVVACFPLGIIMGLITLRFNVPVYFIEASQPIEQVGYYSSVAYFIVAGNLVITSLIQAAAPKLSQQFHTGDTSRMRLFLVKMSLIAVLFGMFGILLASFWGDQILRLLYGPEFMPFSNLLVWIFCASAIGFLAQMLGLTLTVARLFRYQVVSNLAGTAVVIAGSYLLMPVYGILGGGMAIAAGNAIILFFNYMAVLKARVVSFA